MKITPEAIITLEPNQIFVFGSNYAGRHGKGAAKLARQKFGAVDGQGLGLMGRSYGIATKGQRLEVLPLQAIETQIDRLLDFARARPELEFLVTKIGCGLAGYSTEEIRACFVGKRVPDNIALPAEFQV